MYSRILRLVGSQRGPHARVLLFAAIGVFRDRVPMSDRTGSLERAALFAAVGAFWGSARDGEVSGSASGSAATVYPSSCSTISGLLRRQ